MPRLCGLLTPTGPCRRAWTPTGCGAQHSTTATRSASLPALAANVHATKPAVAQLAAMPDPERQQATTALEALGDPADVARRGEKRGDTPAGPLYYLRAGLVRVLVAVDHDDITIVGFGSRSAGSASKGPRAVF